MHLIQNEFYHVYNRGNNKQKIFFSDANYLFFLKNIRTQLSPACKIISYCLMPNHFHFIIMATEKSITERSSFGGKPMQEFPYRIGILLSSYSQAINKQNKTTGSLFQQKTKSKILVERIGEHQENYLVNCFHYLHRNPLNANLVKELSQWHYSSFLDYAALRNGTLCDKELFFSLTGLTVSDVINGGQNDFDEDYIKKFY
jgi:putative transposase